MTLSVESSTSRDKQKQVDGENISKMMFDMRLILSNDLRSLLLGVIDSQHFPTNTLSTFPAHLVSNFLCDVYEHPAMNVKYRSSYHSAVFFRCTFYVRCAESKQNPQRKEKK